MIEEYSAPEFTFRFVEFNPRRHMRGAPAARVAVSEDGSDEEWLWMTVRDIQLNIKEFGPNDELFKALNAYRAGK